MSDNQEIEKENVIEESDDQLTSLDTLWRLAFKELDEWAKLGDFRDEAFLKQAGLFADGIRRNQENLKVIVEQFNKDFEVWERMAREEFLMSTTSLAHFFPLKSYEDINAQIDQIQEKTMSILKTPYQKITTHQAADKYLEIIDQYISVRKKIRKQYLNSVKQAGNLIFENQKSFVNLFARRIKSIMFPLNKYLEKTDEIIKS